MWFRRTLAYHDPAARRGAAAHKRSPKFGPRAVEALEGRALMSHMGHHHMLPQPLPPTRGFTETNLVTDSADNATHGLTGKPVIDSNLVNPWGIAFSPTSPFWVADNGTGVSTLYNGAGTPQSLVVTIPPPGSQPGATAAPTGTVFNSTSDFVVPPGNLPPGTKSGPSIFIFATEDGTISGWNPKVDPNNAILAVDNSQTSYPGGFKGAVYKGLAQASINGANFLYATNFRSGQVDVFDSKFNPVGPSQLSPHAFQDPNIPNDFAPFGIQTINGNLYVTYAKQDAAHHDDEAGVGNGFVDVYDPSGKLLQRVAAHGALDSPWGLTVAPAGFGQFGGALLVGNFGNSHVNAFDLRTGAFLGQLTGKDGQPLVLNGGFVNTDPTDTKGLWGITFDNGVPSGSTNNGVPSESTNTLYFAAGINDEMHGLFGIVKPASK